MAGLRLQALELDSSHSYNLSDDIGEQSDLSSVEPAKAKELREKLRACREKVGAQMPTPNPDYDPQRADAPKRAR